MLKLLIAMLFLSAVATAQTRPFIFYESRELRRLPYVDPELRLHVLSFIMEMQSNGIDISRMERLDSIIIVDDNMTICGSKTSIGCAYGHDVKIKKWSYYYQDSFTYLRQMIYHELGHAVLRLPHYNARFAIMNGRINDNISLYGLSWNMLIYDMLQYYYFCRYHENLL